MVALQSLLSTVLSLAVVSAHFTLDYPASRGFSDDEEPSAPCGGFNSVSTNRSSFPMSGGRYQIDSHHAQASVEVVFSRDGETFGQSPAETYTMTGLGTLCGVLSTSALAGYEEGSNVTMQIIYKASSESSALYQCADLTLTSGSETPGTCANGTGISVSQLAVAASQASGSAMASGSSTVTSSSRAASGTAAQTSARAASGAPYTSSWKSVEIFAGLVILASTLAFVV